MLLSSWERENKQGQDESTLEWEPSKEHLGAAGSGSGDSLSAVRCIKCWRGCLLKEEDYSLFS